MKEDKRRDTRVHTIHLVSYTKFSPEMLPEIMGMANTVDLSEGGLKLTTKEPFEPGDVLHLDFTVEDKLIRTDARVVHVQEIKHYNVGLAFGEGLDPDEREKIQDYLEKHLFKDKTQEEI